MADISNEIQNFREAIYGEDVRQSMISLAEKVNTEATSAKESSETAVKNASIAISTADNAASQCNLAASNANAKAVIAENAAQAAEEIRNTVQSKLDNGDFVGPQGIQGEPGKPFQVTKVYESVAAMNSGYSTDEVEIGQFVVINTGSVEDEDNAKLYLKGNAAYEYITDLSGAQGMEGPQGIQGIQGPKGETGDPGPEGPPGSVENLGSQALTYAEPADPGEGETESIPESGNSLGTIVGWIMKKIKSLIASVDLLNSNIQDTIDKLPYINAPVDSSLVQDGFLYISFSKYGRYNKSTLFRQPSGQSYTNCPEGLSNKEFMGMRDVIYYGEKNILVRITEMYPIPGRIWNNFYNSGTWSGWKSITPS